MNIENAKVSPGLVLVKIEEEKAEFLADIPLSNTGTIISVGKSYDDYIFEGKPGQKVLIAKESKVYDGEGFRYVIVNHTDVLLTW